MPVVIPAFLMHSRSFLPHRTFVFRFSIGKRRRSAQLLFKEKVKSLDDVGIPECPVVTAGGIRKTEIKPRAVYFAAKVNICGIKFVLGPAGGIKARPQCGRNLAVTVDKIKQIA